MTEAAISEKTISWKTLDLPVEGTITAPSDAGPHPAIIFLAGSGPTDRNWCSPLLPGNNGTARILAEFLARRGFVTLRYDKLGSGPHAKEYVSKLTGKVSMQTFADELSEAVETVLSEGNVIADRLFALANSEGCIHAVNYQLQTKTHGFGGLVLTGAPGRTVGEVARSQLLEQMDFVHHAPGATGALIGIVSKFKPLPDTETTMKHYDEAIEQFVSGRPVEPDSSLPKGVKNLLMGLTTPTNQPFSRELWTYDLSQHLSKVDAPVLVLIGKKDIQVDWQKDGKALESAVSQRDNISFVYPENANHLLKYEEKPREKLNSRYVASHYNSADAKLDEVAKNDIFGWLDEQNKN